MQNDRLAQQFVVVGNDVRRIEQATLAKPGKRNATAVGSDDSFPERILMQTLFHDSKGVVALCCLRWRREVVPFGQAERDSRLELHGIPPGNESRDQSVVSALCDAAKIDYGKLVFVGLAQP